MSQLATRDELFDRIEKYYRTAGTGRLSPKEEETCERWELAFAIFSAQKNKKVAITKYLSVLKSKGIQLSMQMAYRDFLYAEKIFAPLQQYSKDFLKMVIIESALKDVKKAEKLAEKQTDPKMWADIMKVKDKAEKRIIEASGLNVTDPNLPDFSKLQLNQININVDQNTISMFKRIMQRGTIDITELYTKMTDEHDQEETL